MTREEFKVRYYEMDKHGTVPMHALLNYFQEAAGTDAHSLAFGWEDFKDKGEELAWVITRIQIELTGKPIPKQTLAVETWHSFSERLISRRDFVIKDEKGEVVAKGASWWIIMNLTTRRPIRMLPSILALNPAQPNFAAEEANFDSPDFEGKIPFVKKDFLVRGEDIDLNGHVNNTHYVAWAVESVPEEVRNNYYVKKLLITFKSECVEGQQIASNTYNVEDNKFWHILERRSDVKQAAKIYTEWAPRP